MGDVVMEDEQIAEIETDKVWELNQFYAMSELGQVFPVIKSR